MAIHIEKRANRGWLGSVILKYEADYEQEHADRLILDVALAHNAGWWNCYELLDMIDKMEGKPSEILATMLEMRQRRGGRRHATPAQIGALRHALLDRHGTASAAIAAALGTTEDELRAAGRKYLED